MRDRKILVNQQLGLWLDIARIDLLSSVPQGSVLGPVSIIIFINDTPMYKNVDVNVKWIILKLETVYPVE